MDPGEALREISRLLGGSVPRRAVLLPDGRLGEKKSRGDAKEVHAISAICELIRMGLGLDTYPRIEEELMELCLSDNAPSAWHALFEDVRTDSADSKRLGAYFDARPVQCEPLAHCLVSARTAAHVMAITSVATSLLPHTGDVARGALARALGMHVGALVDSCMRAGQALSSTDREYMFASVGSLLKHAGASERDVTAALFEVLRSSHHIEDVLRIFLHAPLLSNRAHDLLAVLVQRAESITPSTRHPCLALIARILTLTSGDGLEERIVQLAMSVLRLPATPNDKRVLVVACRILSTCSPSDDVRVLATAVGRF